MIRVFVADDHDIVRKGIRRIIDEVHDMTMCGEASTTEQLLDRIRESKADVLTLDINMPGSKGPKTVSEILALSSPPKIAIFSMYNEDSYAISYLRAGASAFLSKKRSSSELIDAIRTIYEGNRFITPELAKTILSRGVEIDSDQDVKLTERELQVLRLLSVGLRSVKIADEMGISVSTVNTYVQRIKEKLGATSIIDVVEYAKDNDLT